MQYTYLPIEQNNNNIGILLVNLGTPEAPDTNSVRRYLAEFLSDPRVVEKPRWLWKAILHGFILRIRPARSAAAYQKVWQEDGSPILSIAIKQSKLLQQLLDESTDKKCIVKLAMRYGSPSISDTLDELQQENISKLLVFPLYPQYCASTTASVFDSVTHHLRKCRWIPEIRFINRYYDRSDYIQALAQSIRGSWSQHGRGQKLILSYHGIPISFVEKGDPYYDHCKHTTQLLQQSLELKDDQLMMVFQSRVGREKWLSPYCDETMKNLPSNGITDIDIISPAFSADCLETIEELDEENRDYFMQAGGKRYHYISALNDRADHMHCMENIVKQHILGW